MCFHWLKRKQVNIPVHDEGTHGHSCLCVPVWICKGDLNERYNSNKIPKQSFLFCLKAKQCDWEFIFFHLLVKTTEFNLFREVVFCCFKRRLLFYKRPSWEQTKGEEYTVYSVLLFSHLLVCSTICVFLLLLET